MHQRILSDDTKFSIPDDVIAEFDQACDEAYSLEEADDRMNAVIDIKTGYKNYRIKDL
ncbi:MAG: hypothetical protein ACXAD7_28720 [Candidatus Kariarchaeaceae archaeon]